MRSEVLREMALFKGCDPNFVSKIIEDVDIRFFKPGDIILQEGDEATTCYILNRGEVAVLVGGEEVAKLRDGSIFGEICLLGLSQRRTASIKALEVCDVRVVHRHKFQFALKGFPVERARFREEAKKRMAELTKNEAKKDNASAPKATTELAIPSASQERTNAAGRRRASKDDTSSATAPSSRSASRRSSRESPDTSKERASRSGSRLGSSVMPPIDRLVQAKEHASQSNSTTSSRRGSSHNPLTSRSASKDSTENSYRQVLAASRIRSKDCSTPRPPRLPQSRCQSPLAAAWFPPVGSPPVLQSCKSPPVGSPAPPAERTAIESNTNANAVSEFPTKVISQDDDIIVKQVPRPYSRKRWL